MKYIDYANIDYIEVVTDEKVWYLTKVDYKPEVTKRVLGLWTKVVSPKREAGWLDTCTNKLHTCSTLDVAMKYNFIHKDGHFYQRPYVAIKVLDKIRHLYFDTKELLYDFLLDIDKMIIAGELPLLKIKTKSDD